MNIRPVVLTIAGVDPSGGAGVLADVRTIAAFGCFPAAAITSLTFQNTTGVFGSVHQTAEVLLSQIQPIIDDSPVAAVKTGMLPTAEIVGAVAKLCESGKLPAPVVDPVMLSTSGHDLIDDHAFKLLKNYLLRQARVVTPNIPEAERFIGFEIHTEDEMRRAAEEMQSWGVRAVLIKGGHRPTPNEATGENEAIDLLLDENGVFTLYRTDYLDVGDVHGSGCTLSAAIAACLAKEMTLAEAVAEAKSFVTEAIRSSQQIGRGTRPLFGQRT
jgi:hydroxymethylpyrimidine kinase/phosphomethylpyrimidine kinase